MEQNFDSWTVIQLKNFLKLKGITVSSGVTKLQLINLCKAAEPLQDDPNLYQCSTKEIVQRKLSMIGIVCDPMSLLYNSNFTSHDIPPFGLIDIFNYLVNSRADYDNKKLKAYKSFDDYRLYEDGHIQSLSLKKLKNHYIFLASVLPTCRAITFLQKPAYSCWFLLNNEGEVYTAYCECMLG